MFATHPPRKAAQLSLSLASRTTSGATNVKGVPSNYVTQSCVGGEKREVRLRMLCSQQHIIREIFLARVYSARSLGFFFAPYLITL